jgi:thiol-disulfide isomerase/thioredoxin
MVNFWATWCGPCKIEMPLFVHAYERNRDAGLVVLAVDVQEEPEGVRQFRDQYGLSFPILLDRDGQISTLYRVRGLPTTFFVDTNGVVAVAHRGAFKARPDLMPLLQRIMPGAQALASFLERVGLDALLAAPTG